MDHPIVLHLPGSVFCAMTAHSGEGFYGPKTGAILSGLVRHWIATTKAAPRVWLGEHDAGAAADIDAADTSADDTNAAANDDDTGSTAAPLTPLPAAPSVHNAAASALSANCGYQWKQLFLPNGTELRAIYGGHSIYAKVEAEQIISNGAPTTPSRLANAHGCGTRNAWQAIWLRFPGSTRWQRAAECRR